MITISHKHFCSMTTATPSELSFFPSATVTPFVHLYSQTNLTPLSIICSLTVTASFIHFALWQPLCPLTSNTTLQWKFSFSANHYTVWYGLSSPCATTSSTHPQIYQIDAWSLKLWHYWLHQLQQLIVDMFTKPLKGFYVDDKLDKYAPSWEGVEKHLNKYFSLLIIDFVPHYCISS